MFPDQLRGFLDQELFGLEYHSILMADDQYFAPVY
jgi:hypothetical protein